jgi:hypothetical protein
MVQKKVVISLIKYVMLLAITAYAAIIIGVFIIPHLPLSNRHTFHILLQTQMTLDREKDEAGSEKQKAHLLFLGSSVVERGVNEFYLDSIFEKEHISYYSSNSAAGGFFSKANLVMFRAMLEQGLNPKRVIYGIFLQELNGLSIVHNNIRDEDTSAIKLKKKTLWNVLRYGPESLSSMFDGPNFHIYLFELNNAFRDIYDPNFFQRLSFGENMFERDSSYELNRKYLNDLKEIYRLCKERNIPFAFFNTPVRPKVESLADLPYLKKSQAYNAVEEFAIKNNIPIWNFDSPGLFDNSEFLDTYHLTSIGAHKMTKMLADKIAIWQKGFIEQDVTEPLSNGSGSEIKDSLIRTVFNF